MECELSPPQLPESQAEQNENCEPANVHDENSSVGATTAEQTDFTENEAQPIDDNSNDGGGLPEQCHGEITSTNDDEHNENDETDDIEMHEIVDDENTATIDKNDGCDESNDVDNNETTNNTDNNQVTNDEKDDGHENDDVDDNNDDDVDGDIINAIVDIADVSDEVIANEEVITEEMVIADDCIALEETVGGGSGSGVDGVNDHPANEMDSIFSDLSDCNQLVNDVTEDISHVISTSESLDVASLLESGDFENISSPEAFNWNKKTYFANKIIFFIAFN